MRMASRSHWTAAPATNTLPSKAYCVSSWVLAAMVVNSPCPDFTAWLPVFISRKQPVPYVFFTCPASKQHCPNSAACWSPAAPAIGIFPPITSEDV